MSKVIWNNELYHYGILRRSGRYKWGSGKNPYHHGQDAPKGFFRRKKKEDSKKAEEQQKKKELTKEEIINSGNPKLIKAHANNLTNRELQDAIDHISKLQKLDEIDKESVARGKLTIKNAIDTTQKLSNIAQPYVQMAINYYKDINNNKNQSEIDKLVKSGDIKAILDNHQKLSVKEFENASKRINTLRNLSEKYNADEKKKREEADRKQQEENKRKEEENRKRDAENKERFHTRSGEVDSSKRFWYYKTGEWHDKANDYREANGLPRISARRSGRYPWGDGDDPRKRRKK